MMFKILIILCLKFVVPIEAFPAGEEFVQIISALRFVYSEFRLFLRPFGRFDDVYSKYFSPLSQDLDQITDLALKIKIHSHISLLEWKIWQNKDKMPKKKFNFFEFEIKKLFVSSFFEFGKNNFTLRRYYNFVFCRLLQIKFDLFNTLNEIIFFGETNNRPNCTCEHQILTTLEESRDQISEWMLSDFMHFLPKRPNLMAFFKNVAQNNNPNQMKEIRQKFENLIGVSGFQLIYKTFLEKMQWQIRDPKIPYQILYNEFLFGADTKLRKWRAKIILEKFLYDESAQKLFEDEKAKAIRKEKNLTVFHERIKFIGEMKQIWTIYSENFWFNEKTIRAKIEHLVRRNKGKNLEMVKETLLAHHKEMSEIEHNEKDIDMLWENGPEDTALFRALFICIGESFTECAEKGGQKSAEHLEEFSATEQLKAINCVAKIVKRKARKDEIVAKLHLEKMEEIIGGEFKEKLKKNTKELAKLLDGNGINKMKELLTESEYFSTNESVALSSSDNSSPAESDETYEDANSEEKFGEENIEKSDGNSEENNWQNAIAKNKMPKVEKSKTKSYYGRKEKKKAINEKKQTAEEKEGNNQQQKKTQSKYYKKLAKNKEQKKKH